MKRIREHPSVHLLGPRGHLLLSALLSISSHSGGPGQLHTSLVCVYSELLPSGVAVHY